MNIIVVNKRTGLGRVWSIDGRSALAVSTTLFAVGVIGCMAFQQPRFSLLTAFVDNMTDSPPSIAETYVSDDILAKRVDTGQTGYTEQDSLHHEEYTRLKSAILRDDRKIRGMLTTSKEKLESLVARISFLQSRIIRLEAMGQRIASMAGLSQSEFDLDAPVGLGGPEPVNVTSSSIDLESLISGLEILEKTMDDRWQKLSAIEVLLMGRNIQDRTTPAGMPVKNGWTSSGYGMRTDPFTGRREFHQGIDIAGNKNDKIVAMASGIVTYSGYRVGYGNMVEIRHGDGYKTRYAHNKRNLVSVGEAVEKDQAIAVIGSTGRSTGLHVHFEVLSNNVPVNPKRYLQLK